jgi:tetratricopeptide (TPR) repeat protein
MGQSVRCEACGRPASHNYAALGRPVALCSACVGQYEIQKAYQGRVQDIEDLSREGNYAAALGILQELLNAYGHRDCLGVFRAAIFSHQAVTLEFQGRLAEALEKYRSISVFPDESEMLLNRWSIGRLLDKMGDVSGAIRELEMGLDAAAGLAIPTALTVLNTYAQIMAREGSEVLERYRPLFDEVASWWGLKADIGGPEGGVSLTRSILLASDEERAAVNRFERLRARLKELRFDRADERAVRETLRAYVDTERVGFYRQRVDGWLQQERSGE